jgi:hypothetical protein
MGLHGKAHRPPRPVTATKVRRHGWEKQHVWDIYTGGKIILKRISRESGMAVICP